MCLVEVSYGEKEEEELIKRIREWTWSIEVNSYYPAQWSGLTERDYYAAIASFWIVSSGLM